MTRTQAHARLAELHQQIAALRQQMHALLRYEEPQPLEDYAFETTGGEVRLSALFGRHEALFVVHNMGASCRYCTLWADGFNGVYPHLASRAGFAVSSPDAPEEQAAFANDRHWRFPMVSHRNTSFAEDMGYRGDDGGWSPGLSVFRRSGDGKIARIADTPLGPFDDYCPVWHLFALLPPDGADWQPQYRYADIG